MTAGRSIEEDKTVLIVLSGLPGTGKSEIADGIARTRRTHVLSVDPIESAIVRAGIPQTFETGLAAYLIALTLADRDLEAGLEPVIDAVNSVEAAKDWWRGLAAKHAVELRIIECVVSNEEVHRTRLTSRERGLAFAEPIWDDVQRRQSEFTKWAEPHLTLDAMDPRDVNLAKALAYVAAPSN